MPIINAKGELINAPDFEIKLANNCQAEEVLAQFSAANEIAIEFPSHADGRGFSLAKRLRNLGYCGALRAIGPVIPDQFPDLLACGFDQIEISDAQLIRQPIGHWKNALNAYPISYQNRNGGKKSILEARHVR